MSIIKTIVRGVAACLTLAIVGMAILIDTIIDVMFNILRIVRYQYIKCIKTIIKLAKVDERHVRGWNRMMYCVYIDDVKEAMKFGNLKI